MCRTFPLEDFILLILQTCWSQNEEREEKKRSPPERMRRARSIKITVNLVVRQETRLRDSERCKCYTTNYQSVG
jgi:hypothetical protein